jgi:hypothetical protein
VQEFEIFSIFMSTYSILLRERESNMIEERKIVKLVKLFSALVLLTVTGIAYGAVTVAPGSVLGVDNIGNTSAPV